MKARGSYKPNALEYEVTHDGNTAIIRLYENIKKISEPEGEGGQTGFTGWEFDRYTLKRPHSERLESRVKAETAAWLELARKEEQEAIAEKVRVRRNELLNETDKTQIADAPIADNLRAAFRTYRQQLRDIPEQSGFPYTVEWPEYPAN